MEQFSAHLLTGLFFVINILGDTFMFIICERY